jgi:SAM-dependent methyltransferase
MQPSPLEQQQLSVASAPAATFWHHVRFELVRRHAERSGAHTIVDIGAGSGLLGEHLRDADLEYRFAESSPRLREALVARFGRAALDDGRPLDDGTIVALLDVIEHVDDDGALLGRIAERMRPGAGLVVTVPAMPWLFSSWDADLGHHRRYRRADAADVVRTAGFEVLAARYLFPELVPVAALRRFRASDGSAADFPELPRAVDRVARGVGATTTAVRRIWPVGTSVVVTAVRVRERP